MLDGIGWIATVIFSASYFSRGPATLRSIQAAAACLWVVYGFAIGAFPVVAANAIVAVAALYSLFSRRSGQALSSLTAGPDENSIEKTDSAA